MKSLLTPRKALPLLVMGLCANGFALTTGPLAGSTAVGRALDVSTRVQFDSQDAQESSARCLRADVFYGDSALPADAVRISVQRADGSPSAMVRITSQKPVDEPVVTVVMRAGCADAVTRRFVLLADPPANELPIPLVAQSPVADPQVLGATAATVVARKPERMARTATPKPAPAPRLRLDAAIPPTVQDGNWLRVSTHLNALPSADTTQRAAAALLWQALNAQPSDLLRMGDRMRVLEGEMASLRSASAKHRQDIAALGLGSGASASGPAWPVVIGAILALGGLAAGIFGFRSSRTRKLAAGGQWFVSPVPQRTQTKQSGQDRETEAAFAAQTIVQRAASPDANGNADAARMPSSSGVDFSLDSRGADEEAPRAELPPLEFDFTDSHPAPVESVRPGARVAYLASALHEAEFLCSLGYADKAADVLRAYAETTRDAPALALLELRELCRQTGDDEGLQAAEDDFRSRFGEEAPRGDAGGGLETCEAATARVMAAWPQPSVLKVIEELLFASPATLGGYPSLQAWRDLLWLHELAQDTLKGADAPVAAGAENHPEMTLEKLQAVDFEPAPNRFAMDLSLAEVDLARHRVLDLQDVPRLPPLPEQQFEPPVLPKEVDKPPRAYEDFFDAVGAAEGRALHIR